MLCTVGRRRPVRPWVRFRYCSSVVLWGALEAEISFAAGTDPIGVEGEWPQPSLWQTRTLCVAPRFHPNPIRAARHRWVRAIAVDAGLLKVPRETLASIVL